MAPRRPTTVFEVEEHHPRCRLGDHTGPCRTLPLTVPELHGTRSPEFAPGWGRVVEGPDLSTRAGVLAELAAIAESWVPRTKVEAALERRRIAVEAAGALPRPLRDPEVAEILGVTPAMVGLIRRRKRKGHDPRPVVTV